MTRGAVHLWSQSAVIAHVKVEKTKRTVLKTVPLARCAEMDPVTTVRQPTTVWKTAMHPQIAALVNAYQHTTMAYLVSVTSFALPTGTAAATSSDNAPKVTHFYAYSTSVMSPVIVLAMTTAMPESNA